MYLVSFCPTKSIINSFSHVIFNIHGILSRGKAYVYNFLFSEQFQLSSFC